MVVLADHERRLGWPRRWQRAMAAPSAVHVVAVHRADDVPAVGLRSACARCPRTRAATLPSMLMPLSSYSATSLDSFQAPASAHGLVADAFHQAAVAQEDPGAVVDDRVAGAVELGRQQLLGQREAHGIGQALAQRAGGGFHAGRDVHLRVARRLAVQLAEVAQLAHRQLVAGEVQQRVEQHAPVAVAQHEAVAVGPAGVGRVVAQCAAPQRHGDLGHAHGRAGVAGIGLLHGVHGQGADGVGHQGGVGVVLGHGALCWVWAGSPRF